MKTSNETLKSRGLTLVLAAALVALPFAMGCDIEDGDTVVGPAGTPGTPPPLDTSLEPSDDLPGVNIAVVTISGGSGSGGILRAGDRITIKYTIKRDDGVDIPLSELDSTRIWFAGPSFNYQRVLPTSGYGYSDLVEESVQNSDGSYTYTFPDVIPATYTAPHNDTATYTDGELTGQALLSGTYTICMRAYKYYYEPSGEQIRDVGNLAYDVPLGSATSVDSREVVKDSNCNKCHEQLQMHGGSYQQVKLCLSCHTAGAEDRGGWGTIEFKVMIHKIHNGAHLPSVLGVTTIDSGGGVGARKYDATPVPYRVGSSSSPHVYDEVHFPAWPTGMPQDTGYDALPSGTERGLEDDILDGVTDCAACHGGAAQGDLIYSQQTRRTCGSCHDDVDWTLSYTSNGQTMPAQADDASCATSGCHANTGGVLDPEAAHVNPVHDSALNSGMNITINSIGEDPAQGDGDGKVEAGEWVQLNISVTDDSGANVDPATFYRMSLLVTGPNHNRQMLQRMYVVYNGSPSVDVFGAVAADDYTFNVPMWNPLERIGDSTVPTATLTSSYGFFHDTTVSTVEVREVTGTGVSTTLAAAANQGYNYITVTSAAGMSAGDIIRIDPGTGNVDYYEIYEINGNVLSFGNLRTSSLDRKPRLVRTHANGTTVEVVTLALRTLTTDYTLTPASGQVTLVNSGNWLGNDVVLSCATHFVMPTVYNHPYNSDNTDDETLGEWTGKPLESGTYHVGLIIRSRFYVIPPRTLGVSANPDSTQYYNSSLMAEDGDFLVGTADEIEEYDLISDFDNCNDCHRDLYFHGRRGPGICFTCHGAAGFGAPASDDENWHFRNAIHKVHMGSGLFNASTWIGGMFEEVVFPAWPNGVKHCEMCHGSSNDAWHEPSDRSHSTDQTLPFKPWAQLCGTCHDNPSATGHMQLNTSTGGYESCGACHDPGSQHNVELKHKNR